MFLFVVSLRRNFDSLLVFCLLTVCLEMFERQERCLVGCFFIVSLMYNFFYQLLLIYFVCFVRLFAYVCAFI